MKRLLSVMLLSPLVVGMIIPVWSVFAQTDTEDDINSFLDGLLWSSDGWLFGDEWNSSWGFTSQDTIAVSDVVNDTTVEIGFPTQKKNSANITKYNIIYGTTSRSNIDFSSTKELEVTANINGDQSTIELEWLDASKKYYVTVVPIDSNGSRGNRSEEISFVLNDEKTRLASQNSSNQWNNINNTNTDTTNNSNSTNENHNATDVDMNLANISYTYQYNNDGSVNVFFQRSTVIPWANEVQVSYTPVSPKSLKVDGIVAMTSRAYTLTLPGAWSYNVFLQPLQDNQKVWRERFQLVKVDSLSQTNPTDPNTPIENVPKVWPERSVAFVLLLTLFGYFAVRRLKRR